MFRRTFGELHQYFFSLLGSINSFVRPRPHLTLVVEIVSLLSTTQSCDSFTQDGHRVDLAEVYNLEAEAG